MRRKLLTTLLALLFAISMLGLFACSYPEPTEGLEYELSEDGTYYICMGIGTATDSDIVIADTYNNLPVTSIGLNAFGDCSSLQSITIPDSVTSIGLNAFVNCSSLQSITIPDTVISIDGYAFNYCNGLESVIIPDSVTSIGEYSFGNCSSLESITIGKGVTSIGYQAFGGRCNLESITVKAGNTTYHSKNSCLIETKSKSLILGCKNSIIPTDGSVTSINKGAFLACVDLKNIIISDSVTSIGYNAFAGCTSLESVTIGKGVTSIDNYAFENCPSLESITITNNVMNIGSWAFMACRNLESIKIGKGVTSIGKEAFRSCSGLESIVVENGNTVYHSKDNCLIETESKTLIFGARNSIIPNDGSVTIIGESAFRGCKSLEGIINL